MSACPYQQNRVADGNLLHSTHHGFLDVPGHRAMIAYVFPQLCGSLLSISKLIKVLYCSDFVTGFDKPAFQGIRDVQTGLWTVDLRSLSTAAAEGSAQAVSESSACAAIRLESTADFVNFWHTTFWVTSCFNVHCSHRQRLYTCAWSDSCQG